MKKRFHDSCQEPWALSALLEFSVGREGVIYRLGCIISGVVSARIQSRRLSLCCNYSREQGLRLGIITAETASYSDGVEAEKNPTHCRILSGVFILHPAFHLTPSVGQVSPQTCETGVSRGAVQGAMGGCAGTDINDLTVGVTLSDSSEVMARLEESSYGV